MEVDNLSATDVAETQTTISSRDHEEQERLEQEVITEPEELAQYKWREGMSIIVQAARTLLTYPQNSKMISEIWQQKAP